MTYPEWLDPTFITNVMTGVMVFAGVIVVIKQRAKLILNYFKEKEKDEELEKQTAENAELTYELEMVATSLSTIHDTLNMVVQASKMSSEDKLKIMEATTKNKEAIKNLIQAKQERFDRYKETIKDVKQDPMKALELLNDAGSTILEKYTTENTEQ